MLQRLHSKQDEMLIFLHKDRLASVNYAVESAYGITLPTGVRPTSVRCFLDGTMSVMTCHYRSLPPQQTVTAFHLFSSIVENTLLDLILVNVRELKLLELPF